MNALNIHLRSKKIDFNKKLFYLFLLLHASQKQNELELKKFILFPDGIGNNGSDFTVGAVLLKKGMGNFFKGQIGDLAVFDRSLSEKELWKLSKLD